MSEKRYGRWALGDMAEDKRTGKMYRVIGFITDPAVVFKAINEIEEQRIEVAGCHNELNDLIHYKKEEKQT